MASALYQPPASSSTRRNGFRRRPARAVDVRDDALHDAGAASPASGAAIVIDALDDFVHCTHPGCCALRPVGEGVRCPACQRF
jgi:hypothetical protein